MGWRDDTIDALVRESVIKHTGLPTRGDLFVPCAGGGYVVWDMITGEVRTDKVERAAGVAGNRS